MIARYLRRAVADGHDLEARQELLWAAHMAGLAFGTTGLGVAHAVAHALSARIGAPHGVALAVLLPHVLEFNASACIDTYARAASALGSVTHSTDAAVQVSATLDAVRSLASEVGMPSTLGALGLIPGQISAIVEDALADEVMANTPRLPTAGELQALLERAL
jgi:alcohol dehydrogenase class IV